MRPIRWYVGLVACLAIAGCAGGTHVASQSASPARAIAIAKIAPTAMSHSTHASLVLLKGGEAAALPTATPAVPRATPQDQHGPLSCLEQRLRALRNGKLLPTNQCS